MIEMLKFNSQDYAVYARISHMLKRGEFTVNLPRICSMEEIMAIFKAAIGENPEKIRYDTCSIRVSSTSINYRLESASLWKTTEIHAKDKIFREELQPFISRTAGLDTYNKIKTVYETFVKKVRYVDSGSLGHSAWGPIVEKCGVCEGIALAFGAALKEIGVSCCSIFGSLSQSGAPAKEENHVWNLIRLNGNYYHVDVAAAIGIYSGTGKISYDYLCVSDKVIGSDHKWYRYWFPACTSEDLNYYKMQGLFVDSKEKETHVIRQHIEADKRVLQISYGKDFWDAVHPENRILDKVRKILEDYHRYSEQLSVSIIEEKQWVEIMLPQSIKSIEPVGGVDTDNKRRKKIRIQFQLNSPFICVGDAFVNMFNAQEQAITCKKEAATLGQKELQALRLGHALITRANNGRNEYLVYTKLPDRSFNLENAKKCLMCCFHNSIKAADDKKCRSIIFPCLPRTEIWPPEEAYIRTAVQTILSALKQADYVEIVTLTGEGCICEKYKKQMKELKGESK